MTEMADVGEVVVCDWSTCGVQSELPSCPPPSRVAGVQPCEHIKHRLLPIYRSRDRGIVKENDDFSCINMFGRLGHRRPNSSLPGGF